MRLFVTGYNNTSTLGKFEQVHMVFKTEERAKRHCALCDREIHCNDVMQVFSPEDEE